MRIEKDSLGVIPIGDIPDIIVNIDSSDIKKADDDRIKEIYKSEFKKEKKILTDQDKKILETIAIISAFEGIADAYDYDEIGEIEEELLGSLEQDDSNLDDILKETTIMTMKDHDEEIFISGEELAKKIESQDSYQEYALIENVLSKNIEDLKNSNVEEAIERKEALIEDLEEIKSEMTATKLFYQEEGYDELKDVEKEEVQSDLDAFGIDSAAEEMYPNYYERKLEDKEKLNIYLTISSTESYKNASQSFKDGFSEKTATTNELNEMLKESKQDSNSDTKKR